MINQEFIHHLTKEWLLSLAQQEHQSGIYGDWARLIRVIWDQKDPGIVYNYHEFGVNQQMDKLEVLKKIVSFGDKQPAYLEEQTQQTLTQIINFWESLEEKLAEGERLKGKLATEWESIQQALQTSQEWHERQKNEIIEQWKGKLTNLLNSRKQTLQQEITLIKEVLRE